MPSVSENPRTYGAIADGQTHPIGRRFGLTQEAAAAWRDRGGGRPYAWMTDERFGLRFTLTVSADQAAPGRTAMFNKTVPTIFGFIDFAQFNGDPAEGQKQLAPGWLVSGPGVAAGTSVAALDVAAGSISFDRPFGAPLRKGFVLTFNVRPTEFQALEMDYVGVQSAVAALADHGGGVVTLPAGDYRWNRSVWNPGATDGPHFRGNVSIVGVDLPSSRIEFTADLGPGGCALGDRNRGPASVGTAVYGKFRLLGPGTVRNDGGTVAGMDGLCAGQAARIDEVAIQRFHAGINVVKDHGLISRADTSNNFYGVYFGSNGDSIGNWTIQDSNLNANSWAGLAVAWNNQIDFSMFRNLDLGGGSPYGMYREATPAGRKQTAGFISNTLMEHIFSEQVGLGWIYAENPTDQIDRNVCLHCTAWLNATQFKIPGRRVRAVMAAGHITQNAFIASDLSNGGAHYRLVSDGIVVATDNVQSNDWGDLSGALDGVARSSPPFLAAPTMLFNKFTTDRAAGSFRRAEGRVGAGELLAQGAAAIGAGVRPMAAGLVFAGVAAQSANSGEAVPVLTSGLVQVRRVPGQTVRIGDRLAPSSSDPLAVSAAAPGAVSVGTWADAGSAEIGTVELSPTGR